MKNRNRITFVFGGARSGKSTFAMRLANSNFRKPLYLATAEARDAEMTERIGLHRKARGKKWKCVEEPVEIARIIANPPPCDGILLDCLTLWATNVMLAAPRKSFAAAKRKLIASLHRAPVPVIIVSNEVGMGVVPDSELGRKFRDLAGWLNQDIAAVADDVVFVAAGLPLAMKGEAK